MIGPLTPCVCSAGRADGSGECMCGPDGKAFWLGWLASAVKHFLEGTTTRAQLRDNYRLAVGRGAVDFRLTDLELQRLGIESSPVADAVLSP